MNAVHLHLIINHMPITFMFVGFALALAGLLRKNGSLQSAGMVFMILAAVTAFLAMNTGEGAEEIVEHLPGFDHHEIHEHEEIAEKGFWMSIVVGIMAIVAWWRLMKNVQSARMLVVIATISSLAPFATMTYAGLIGGSIAHHELTAQPGDHEESEVEEREESGKVERE